VYIRITDIKSNEYRHLSDICGSVFNSQKWLNIYDDRVCINGIYNDNDDLIGSFFYYKAAKFGVNYIVNPPFTPNNGLLFINPSQNKSNQNTFDKSVLELVATFFESLNLILVLTSIPTGFKDTQPFSWKKFSVHPKYTYQINLLQPENVLLENLTSEKRKSLNKAEKDGLSIRKQEDLTVVRDLILKTFERQDKKTDTDLINKILFGFADSSNSIAYVAYDGDKPIATSFCIYDKTTAYYILGGYDAANKHHGAGVSTMWACIMHSKSLGLSVFDFEGSMLPDVEKYFREFGGTMIPYFAMTKAPMPIEFILKLFKRTLI
jgi:hypothetical protein